MFCDGAHHLVVRTLGLVFVVLELSVARRQHHLVVLEHGMPAQLADKRLCAVDPVQQPEGVLELVAQFRRGERETRLLRKRVQKSVHFGIVPETPVAVRLEEEVEVESIRFLFTVDVDAARKFVAHHLGHPVRVETHPRKRDVRILGAVRVVPFGLRALLVRIRPVEDGLRRELAARKRLERRT